MGGGKGGSSGGGGTQTVVNTSELPPEIRPLASQISNIGSTALNQLQGFSNIPRQQPGFSTVNPQAAETLQALGLQEARALGGNPLNDLNQASLGDTLRGDFLFGGPGFEAAQAELRQQIPGITSQFAGAGRLNSGLAQVATNQAVSDALARQFGNERENMLRASALAPQAISSDFQDIQALLDVGRQREGRTGAEIQDALNRFNFQQEEGRARALELLGAANGAPPLNQFGLTSTQTGTGGGGGGGTNRFASALGGASTGFSIGGPFGAAAGGILGGLFA